MSFFFPQPSAQFWLPQMYTHIPSFPLTIVGSVLSHFLSPSRQLRNHSPVQATPSPGGNVTVVPHGEPVALAISSDDQLKIFRDVTEFQETVKKKKSIENPETVRR